MQGPTTTAGLGGDLGGHSGRNIYRLLAKDAANSRDKPDDTQAAQRTASFDAVQQLAPQQQYVQQQWTQAKVCATRTAIGTDKQGKAFARGCDSCASAQWTSGASSTSTAAQRFAAEASAQGQANDLPEAGRP